MSQITTAEEIKSIRELIGKLLQQGYTIGTIKSRLKTYFPDEAGLNTQEFKDIVTAAELIDYGMKVDTEIFIETEPTPEP